MPTKRRTIKKAINRKKKTPTVLTPEHQEKLEREKRIAMWAGVTFFIILIAIVWAFNFRNVVNGVRTISKQPAAAGIKIEDTVANFKDMMAETKKHMEELGNVVKNQGQAAGGKEVPAEIKQRIELEKLFFSLNDKLGQAISASDNK